MRTIADRLAEWLHESSLEIRSSWDARTDTPHFDSRYLIPRNVALDIDDDWLASADIDPHAAIADLMEQVFRDTETCTNDVVIDLSVSDLLDIIGGGREVSNGKRHRSAARG